MSDTQSKQWKSLFEISKLWVIEANAPELDDEGGQFEGVGLITEQICYALVELAARESFSFFTPTSDGTLKLQSEIFQNDLKTRYEAKELLGELAASLGQKISAESKPLHFDQANLKKISEIHCELSKKLYIEKENFERWCRYRPDGASDIIDNKELEIFWPSIWGNPRKHVLQEYVHLIKPNTVFDLKDAPRLFIESELWDIYLKWNHGNRSKISAELNSLFLQAQDMVKLYLAENKLAMHARRSPVEIGSKPKKIPPSDIKYLEFSFADDSIKMDGNVHRCVAVTVLPLGGLKKMGKKPRKQTFGHAYQFIEIEIAEMHKAGKLKDYPTHRRLYNELTKRYASKHRELAAKFPTYDYLEQTKFRAISREHPEYKLGRGNS